VRPRSLFLAIGAALGLGAFGVGLIRSQDQSRFPHLQHADLFPVCTSCHLGMIEAGQPIWPDSEVCTACHDGTIRPRVDWRPRAGPRPSNLRFDHLTHFALGNQCSQCHNQPGATEMAVLPARPGPCLECHAGGAPHLEAPSAACATCHLPLVEARALSRERVAGFPKPPSHEQPEFALAGHGKAAQLPSEGGRFTVAASCATCHARDFCITCHVNAPEISAIQALGADERSLALAGKLPVPVTHQGADWLLKHARQARPSTASCAACHTRESCLTCHVGSQPAALRRLPSAGPGRGPGAQTARTAPASHTAEFANRHGPDATARPASCETCHVRLDCLGCHRPASGRGSGFHPEGFLTRHAASAYARDRNCSDCHNPAQFCQSCHQQAGLTAAGRLGAAGYHDGNRAFLIGHGQAARQQLESCASCHAERDCTACHSAIGGGFRFSPHGPGFDPDRMRRKNPSLCIACHGLGVPR